MHGYKTYKFRLNTRKSHRKTLERLCESQRLLYNSMLEERKKIGDSIALWKRAHEDGCPIMFIGDKPKSITYFDQCKELTKLRGEFEWAKTQPVALQRGTIKKLDLAFKAFFDRVKRGDKPGYPRFARYGEWNTLLFAEFTGIRLVGGKVVSKCFGRIPVKLHRKIEGEIKSCTITQDAGKWYVTLSCKQDVPEAAENIVDPVGIDMGVKEDSLMALSNGEFVDNPKFNYLDQDAERILRRKVARCKRGSNNRKKRKVELSRLTRKIANSKNTKYHAITREIVDNHDFVAVEDLTIKNMVKNKHLSRAIQSASWDKLNSMFEYKCLHDGKGFVKVNPRNTSQICSQCGTKGEKKDLSVRWHKCGECGYENDRDTNAARNILQRGLESLPVKA